MALVSRPVNRVCVCVSFLLGSLRTFAQQSNLLHHTEENTVCSRGHGLVLYVYLDYRHGRSGLARSGKNKISMDIPFQSLHTAKHST